MNTIEKQQTIETLLAIVKSRWFYVSAVALQGILIHFFTPNYPMPTSKIITFLIISVFFINFIFWLFLRQNLEKINLFFLKVVKYSQVPFEIVALSSIFYFSGTTNRMLIMMYIVPIIVSANLFKKRGIILTTIAILIIYNFLVFMEYYGHLYQKILYEPGKFIYSPLYGNFLFAKIQLFFFNIYILGVAFYAGYLSNLFKGREQRLINQKEELIKKTDLLTDQSKKLQIQAQRLSAAKSGLEAEKNKVEAVIRSLADGLLLLDANGRIAMANKTAKQFLGLADLPDLLGKKIKEIETPEIKELIKILSAETEHIERVEMPLTQKNLILEISTADVHDTGGHKFGQIIILHDVTREKAIDKIKSDFVTIAAHQLRTPLTAIKWVFNILLSGDAGQISQEQKEILNKGNKSNDRIIILIDDLLQAARIEEGRFIYEFKEINFVTILDKVLNKLAHLAQEKKIKIVINKPNNFVPTVKADEEKLEIALTNLIENALFYTPESGTINIALSPTPEGKHLLLEIKDNGIGIPRENFDRVFSKFFRAENAIKAQTEGSGLGLFIVKNIIESHNGKIWFESEEGIGTTFYVGLPIE